MAACDRTHRIVGFVCLVLGFALVVFTNKAAWGVCIKGEDEERRDANASRLETWGFAPARGPDDAGCDRRWLFSTLCLIPVGGLLAPGLYFTFFC